MRDQPVEAVLDEAFAVPERMATKDGKLFVVLLDEFQAAVGLGGQRLLSRMRATMQRQDRTAYLFLGSQASLMAQLFGSRKQPFFRFATWLDLPPIPNDAWRPFIRDRLAERHITIEDVALDIMLDYTGGHLNDTMEVALEAYMAGRRRRNITGHLARAACATVQERSSKLFEAEIDHAGPRAKPLLARVANGMPLFEDERSKDVVGKALKELVQMGLLRHVGRGRYEITEPMMRYHLRH